MVSVWPELSQSSSFHREGLLCLLSHWGDPPLPSSRFLPSLLFSLPMSLIPFSFLPTSFSPSSSLTPSFFSLLPSLQGLEYIGPTRGSRLAPVHLGNPSSFSSSPWLLVWHPFLWRLLVNCPQALTYYSSWGRMYLGLTFPFPQSREEVIMVSIFLSLSLPAWSLDSETEELVLIKGGWCHHSEAYLSDLPDYRHQGKTGEKRQKMKRRKEKK